MSDESLAPARTLKRLGTAKVNAFFQHLGRTGSVSLAAARAGLRRSTLYHLRNQHPGFARRWQDAIEMGVDRLQDDAMRRALEGIEKPVWRNGKQVGSVKQFDNRMIQFLLRSHKPAIYGDRSPPAQVAPAPLGLVERMRAAEKRAAAHRAEVIERRARELIAEWEKEKEEKGKQKKV